VSETATPTRPSVYTAADLALVEQVKKWLVDHGESRAFLSRKTKIPNGTISQILNGKYASPPSQQLQVMAAALAVETERLSDGPSGYVKTSVHTLLNIVCDRTRKNASIGVFCGYVGTGKTKGLTVYRQNHPQTLLIESSPKMTPGVLLMELLQQLNVAAPAGLDNKFRTVTRALKGANYLILVDEANRVNADSLEYLRRIRDMAGVGVVLVGTEKLAELIQPERGQFDQVRSRVGMWPATVKGITRDDADDLARAALPDAGDLSDEVLETLWRYCDGSARVLMEGFVPNIRDYCMDRLPLKPAHIEAVARDALFMHTPGRRGGAK
jgi:DNA transposition AAA+ family ATPase